MKHILSLLFLALMGAGASAQSLGVSLVLTTPSAAAAVTVDPTTGAETSGPILFNIYRTPATITAGVATCKPFDSTWALLTPNGMPGTSSAANANTFVDNTLTASQIGSIFCYAANDEFQAGGSVSAATVSSPIVLIIIGNASAPTNLGASVVPVS